MCLLTLSVVAGLGSRAGAQCTGDATQLYFPLDGSYALVDFFGDGATGSGPATGPDQHNDDDSATVPLNFTFNLYGDLYAQAYVNNNGNISFVTPYSTFSATGFPDPSFIMVAPFWGDVDTGNSANFIGDVHFKQYDSDGDTFDDTLIVTWNNVGYFNEHPDLRNTFQVAISNGTNPTMGLGNNICFSYDNMCWTTGDASSGVGGFGGVPATVGANRGNGIDYFQIGRFDHAGVDYDGNFGNPDGVSYLDGQTTCFNATGGGTTNIAPIPQNFPPGNSLTVDACAGEIVDLDVSFLSPELGQTTTVGIVDVNGAQAAGLLITNTPGNVATVMLDWVPDAGDVGSYVLNFTATDDFVPPGVTNVSLTLNITCGCGNGTVDPGEDCDPPGSGCGSPFGAFVCTANCTCPQQCGNGVIDPGEDCDPPGSITCPPGSPLGAFLACDQGCECPFTSTTTTSTTTSTTTTTSCQPSPENCTNGVDDDCDLLIDCSDPDCQPARCEKPPRPTCVDDQDCPGVGNRCLCPDIRKDPSTIRFGAGGLDRFSSHGRVVPGSSIDVGNAELTWLVTNDATGEVVYEGTLYPGDMSSNPGKTTFRFLDRGARSGHGFRNGLYRAKIRITRGGTSYGYKVQAYGDMAAASGPQMTIQLYLGKPPRSFVHSETWTQQSWGWKATGFD
jgi:hypothetical protein